MNLITTWISDWFMPREATTEELPAFAGAGLLKLRREQVVGHSPQLVGRLRADHRHLLSLYAAVSELLAQQSYAAIPAALGQFKSRFDAHVLLQNLRLYCYLERRLHGPALTMARDFRGNMDRVARGVAGFVRKYQVAGVSDANRRVFDEELRLVGALLRQRIEAEERELYPLYAA